jgi:RNA polymerase sigma factor (sigma-70 family)
LEPKYVIMIIVNSENYQDCQSAFFYFLRTMDIDGCNSLVLALITLKFDLTNLRQGESEMNNSILSIELLKSGDNNTWESAFRLLWPCAYHAAFQATGKLSADEAEDIAIRALEELTRRISKVKTFEDLQPFVSHISRCLAITELRKKLSLKRGEGQTVSLEDWHDQAETKDSETLELGEILELDHLLRKGLALLDTSSSLYIEEHFLNGLSYKEISSKHNVPIGTVCTLLARGIKKIQGELDQFPNLVGELKEFLR